jgi:UDP-N-acetylglucosamine enolpyruvyl transferase
VTGVDKLSGATVMATDLRASASLVIAGLAPKARRSSTASITWTAATTAWKRN